VAIHVNWRGNIGFLVEAKDEKEAIINTLVKSKMLFKEKNNKKRTSPESILKSKIQLGSDNLSVNELITKCAKKGNHVSKPIKIS
jgi:hypothetical protein